MKKLIFIIIAIISISEAKCQDSLILIPKKVGIFYIQQYQIKLKQDTIINKQDSSILVLGEIIINKNNQINSLQKENDMTTRLYQNSEEKYYNQVKITDEEQKENKKLKRRNNFLKISTILLIIVSSATLIQ